MISGRKVPKVQDDPDDIGRVTDADLLTRLMKAYVEQKDCQRMGRFKPAAEARTTVEQCYTEARRRMARRDPVLRGSNA